jgi:hypothetical protein
MTNTARWTLLAFFASTSAALPLACGGDNGNGDAGPDGTTADAAGNDAATTDASTNDATKSNDGSCPTYSGSVEFCKAAIDRCNACGASSINLTACDVANLDALCNWANGIFSPQFQAAAESCANLCEADAQSSCSKAALADASLSTAQQKTATDYCAECGKNAGCAAQFASQFNLAEYSDTVAAALDKCTPDAGGPDSGACGVGYFGCAFAALTTALAGNPCADAGGD